MPAEAPTPSSRLKRLFSSDDSSSSGEKKLRRLEQDQFYLTENIESLDQEIDDLRAQLRRADVALGEANAAYTQLSSKLYEMHDEYEAHEKQLQAEHEAREKKIAQDMFLQNHIENNQKRRVYERQRLRMSRVQASREHALQTALTDANLNLKTTTAAMEADRKTFEAERTNQTRRYDSLRREESLVRMRYEAAVTDASNTQDLLHTALQDLQDVRQSCHEEMVTFTNRYAKGLPPAYGSLDENPLANAPWGRNDQDGGHAHIACMESIVRTSFSEKHDAAQYEANERRNSYKGVESLSAGSWLFLNSTQALYDTCIALSEVLKKASDIQLSSGGKEKCRPDYDENTSTNRLSHAAIVADRVANLILGCCWQIIAGIDMRHYDVLSNTTDKAKIGVFWHMIDATLMIAIKIAITSHRKPLQSPIIYKTISGITIARAVAGTQCSRCDSLECNGHCERMYEMSIHNSKLKSVTARLESISGHVSNSAYFGDTLKWLCENIETERKLSAACYVSAPSPEPPEPSSEPPSPRLGAVASGSGTSDTPPGAAF